MVRKLTGFKKSKEKHTFQYTSIDEFLNSNRGIANLIKKINIPKNRKSLVIKFNENDCVVEIDFVSSLEVEGEKKDDRRKNK